MDDEDLTVWCGNLPSEVDEELLFELFLQAAPLKKVRIPNDNKSGRPANYAFVTFKHDVSVAYAVSLLHGTKLYGKSIIVRQRNSNQSPVGPKLDFPPVPIRPQYNQTGPRNHYESKGQSGWAPYNKEIRRGESKHYRHDNHYSNSSSRSNNRGGNWGGLKNRFSEGNDHYGHNNRRRR